MCADGIVHAKGTGRVVARIDIVQLIQRHGLPVYFQCDSRLFVPIPGGVCYSVVSLYPQPKGYAGVVAGLGYIALFPVNPKVILAPAASATAAIYSSACCQFPTS